MDYWYLYFVWVLPVATLLYIASFIRFYRKDFHWGKEEAVGWQSRFKIAMFVPLGEAVFYLLFCIGVVALTIQGDDKGSAEMMLFLLLAPVLMVAKAGSVVKGFGILSSVNSSVEEIRGPGFYTFAKRQLNIIICYSFIAAAPFIAFLLPGDYENKASETRIMAKINIETCRSALAFYAANSGDDRFPVGKLEYDQFRHFFPEANLPIKEEDAGFEDEGFVYDSEDGKSYIIWVRTEGTGIIRGSPSGIVPSK